ncbi:MAG: hypothetical protein VX815_07725 [Gemmatimonadota bacterium]|nr:hypothetical protein [Gemmatimonadota bacterium]
MAGRPSACSCAFSRARSSSKKFWIARLAFSKRSVKISCTSRCCSVGTKSAPFQSMSDASALKRPYSLIGPDKKIKATLTYPMSTGRNFAEILRLLDSCQLTAQKQLATPANWEQGGDVIISPAVNDEEARRRFPDGWQQPLPYIRLVPQPSDE